MRLRRASIELSFKAKVSFSSSEGASLMILPSRLRSLASLAGLRLVKADKAEKAMSVHASRTKELY